MKENDILSLLRQETGLGISQCKDALDIFDNNKNQAYEFLRMITQPLCIRRKSDGELWSKQDYIDYIKQSVV